MSTVVASLIAKIGADTSGFEKGAAGVKGGLTSLLENTALLTAGIAALEQGFKQTVGVAQEYDQSIYGIMASTGGTADETSRLVQVMDDAGVSLDTVKRALKEMAKDGTAPTIEELARLSDEFLAFEDPASRGQFLLDKFGKSGGDMARAMALGGDNLRRMNAEQSGGLILTEANIQASEDYRKNLDELSDSFEGVKVSIGNKVIPALNEFIETMQNNNVVIVDGVIQTGRFGTVAGNAALSVEIAAGQVDSATQSYMAWAQSIEESRPSIEEQTILMQEQAAAAKELTDTYYTLLSGMMDMQGEKERYNEIEAESNAKIAEANALLATGAISQEEHDAIISDSTATLNENAEAHKRWAAETIYAFALARAGADGNISKGEGEILIAVGEQLGLFDAQTATAMENVNAAFDSLDTSNAVDVTNAITDALRELTGETWVINIETNTSQVNIPSSPVVAPAPPTSNGGGISSGAMQSYGSRPELFLASSGGAPSVSTDQTQGMQLVINNYGNITMPENMTTASLAEAFG